MVSCTYLSWSSSNVLTCTVSGISSVLCVILAPIYFPPSLLPGHAPYWHLSHLARASADHVIPGTGANWALESMYAPLPVNTGHLKILILISWKSDVPILPQP